MLLVEQWALLLRELQIQETVVQERLETVLLVMLVAQVL
jgi:hypothetical protein